MNNSENKFTHKRIAIVAFDTNRTELIEWSYGHKDFLHQHTIIANGATATLLEGTLNTPVTNLPSGSLGGYQQLANMIDKGKIDILLYFGDPGNINEQHAGMLDLLPLANRQDILISCSSSTTDLIMKSLKVAGETVEAVPETSIPKSNFLHAIGKAYMKVASVLA